MGKLSPAGGQSLTVPGHGWKEGIPHPWYVARAFLSSSPVLFFPIHSMLPSPCSSLSPLSSNFPLPSLTLPLPLLSHPSEGVVGCRVCGCHCRVPVHPLGRLPCPGQMAAPTEVLQDEPGVVPSASLCPTAQSSKLPPLATTPPPPGSHYFRPT